MENGKHEERLMSRQGALGERPPQRRAGRAALRSIRGSSGPQVSFKAKSRRSVHSSWSLKNLGIGSTRSTPPSPGLAPVLTEVRACPELRGHLDRPVRPVRPFDPTRLSENPSKDGHAEGRSRTKYTPWNDHMVENDPRVRKTMQSTNQTGGELHVSMLIPGRVHLGMPEECRENC